MEIEDLTQNALSDGREVCIFADAPWQECYCFNMNSSTKVREAVYYCGGHFNECEIYQRRKIGPRGEANEINLHERTTQDFQSNALKDLKL